MNATSRPRCTEACWNAPNSARQGAHHDAHLLITTGGPSQRRKPLAQRAETTGKQLGGLRVQRRETGRGAAQASPASRRA